MPATVQLNTRIDPEVKRRGDAVFARANLTASEVVRSVWTYAAQTQLVPDCVATSSLNTSEALEAIRDGSGLGLREAGMLGITAGSSLEDIARARQTAYDSQAEKIHGELAAS